MALVRALTEVFCAAMPAVRHSVTLVGVDRLRAALIRERDALTRSAVAALTAEARAVLATSKALVPVESGALRDSGRVHSERDPLASPGSISVAIRYGESDPASAYAIAVHEHPSASSPPSWKGGAEFARGGPKFLERPLNDAAPGIASRMAARMKR